MDLVLGPAHELLITTTLKKGLILTKKAYFDQRTCRELTEMRKYSCSPVVI